MTLINLIRNATLGPLPCLKPLNNPAHVSIDHPISGVSRLSPLSASVLSSKTNNFPLTQRRMPRPMILEKPSFTALLSLNSACQPDVTKSSNFFFFGCKYFTVRFSSAIDCPRLYLSLPPSQGGKGDGGGGGGGFGPKKKKVGERVGKCRNLSMYLTLAQHPSQKSVWEMIRV